jgi:hypothetical protein
MADRLEGGAGNRRAIQNKYNRIKEIFDDIGIKNLVPSEREELERVKNEGLQRLTELGQANPRHNLFFKGPFNQELNDQKIAIKDEYIQQLQNLEDYFKKKRGLDVINPLFKFTKNKRSNTYWRTSPEEDPTGEDRVFFVNKETGRQLDALPPGAIEEEHPNLRFVENFNTYFLPKLGISDESRERILRWYQILNDIAAGSQEYQEIIPKLRQDVGIKIRDEWTNFIPTVFLELRNVPHTFNFTIPRSGKFTITPTDRKNFDKAVQFFRSFPVIQWFTSWTDNGRGTGHAVTFKRKLGTTNLVFLDSNGLPIQRSENYTKMSEDFRDLLLEIINSAGLTLTEDTCSKFQTVGTCYFFSLINTFYYDFTSREIETKLLELVTQNGIHIPVADGTVLNLRTRRRYMEAALLAIFQLFNQQGFVRAEEALPDHKRSGWGKCRKCGLKKK